MNCTLRSLDVGQDFSVVRKNTFLEVVSCEEPEKCRGRTAMSEPSRSRETTPQPLERYQDGDSDSPSTTPMVSSRAMWNEQNFNTWSNDGAQNNAQYNAQNEWVPNYESSDMYFVPGQQWVYYDNQMVQFAPYEGEAYGCQEYDCQDPQTAPTQTPNSTHNPSSAGSDNDAPADDAQRWRRDERTLLGDTRNRSQFAERRRPGTEKDKKDKKRKPRLGKAGGKVFVGGLASKTTEETISKVFAQYGTVAQANVLLDPASRRSRGFGYVTFSGEVPENVVDRDHMIDGRLCGARLYKY